MKQVVIGVIIIVGVIGLSLLIMQLIVGIRIYNSERNYTSNWYNNEFYKERFKGRITNFVKRDSSTYWLLYQLGNTNQPILTGDNNYSFELFLNAKDSVIFNQSVVNKIIAKDSATKKVKLFIDRTHFKEIDIPFSFLYKK